MIWRRFISFRGHFGATVRQRTIATSTTSVPLSPWFSRSKIPLPNNEPVLGFMKGSPEREQVMKKLKEMRAAAIEIPLIIGGKEVRTSKQSKALIPHEHINVLATFHEATEKEVKMAIDAALMAKKMWSEMDFETRASIFMKAAELLSGPWRSTLLAATILGQSKNFFQAEIDAAVELIDFLRFNAYFAQEIYNEQPLSPKGVWNRLVYRPLEGFVYAITPFNFTAIGGNLTSAPALMGNSVVWKPSNYSVVSNYYTMKLFQEAGLPDGVINFIPGDPELVTKVILSHVDFAGLHYTGSSQVFRHLWKNIGQNIDIYRSYPRVVGETGGKDFVVAHGSADIDALVTALIRGAFEYSGQKCSAASRAYIPESIWPTVKQKLIETVQQLKMGNPEDPTVFLGAVIHKGAFEKIRGYIEWAKNSNDCLFIAGGKYEDKIGYFIEPTIIQTTNPTAKIMVEEIFGPVLSVYVFKDADYEETLRLVDSSTPYALTGSVFARDRTALNIADKLLQNAAGNFYINDKPTGSVVAQQPFGGARSSGTNDKAGSALNLLRWVSPRTVKETFVPPTHFSYPYMS